MSHSLLSESVSQSELADLIDVSLVSDDTFRRIYIKMMKMIKMIKMMKMKKMMKMMKMMKVMKMKMKMKMK